MKLNKKGFTLTELLVVVAILGIITGISIPLIRNLSKTFEKKKYQNYADSVLAAAKIYNDSYSEDLFGHNEHGCAYITYSQLVERDLLKDITIDNVSCNSNSTFVRVIKQRDKYSYAGFLGCGKKNSQGKASSIDTSLPKANTEYAMDTTYCTGVNENNLLITVDDTWMGGTFNKKRKTTSLTIKSGTGINNNIVIYTAWKSKETGEVTAWEKASFKVKGNQEKELLNGNIITTTSNQLITPKNGNGEYALLVRVDNLQDLYGSKWKNIEDPTSNQFSKEPFRVDSTPPVITNLAVTSNNENWNTLKTNVEFDANDKYTAQNKLKMCITDKSNKCSSNSEFKDYSKTSEFTLSNTTYDGSDRTIYIYVKDLAGNIAKTTSVYTVSIKNTVTYELNGGTGCSEDKRNVYYQPGTQKKWGPLCRPTKSGYDFDGWNTKSDGTGTTITDDTIANGDLTIYAQWTPTTYTITLNNNGATTAGSSSATVKYKDTKLSTITKPQKVVTINYVNEVGATVSGGDSSKSYTLNGWYTASSNGTKVASSAATPALQASVSGYTNADSKWTKTSGATLYAQWANVTATLPTITKTGHTCVWTTIDDGTEKTRESGGTWNFVSANTRTFTAKCTAKTITVTFKKNGSSVSGTDNQKQTFTYGVSGQKFSAKGFSWTGHTQGKWAESSDGSGIYNIESGVSDDWINSNAPSITLYATWSLSKYTVTLNGNGETTAGSASATATYTGTKLSSITNPQKKVTLTYVNNVGATVSGGDSSKSYTLNGWYTATSGGTKVASNATTPALQASVSGYTDSNSKWTRTSGATLYAQWANVTATLPTVTKKGYTCVWTTDNGSSTVNSGGTWTFSSANSRTFTAKCTAKTIKVTFKPNGGTGSDKTQTFTYGVSGQSFSAKGYSKTGYNQGKWAESASGSGVYNIESGVNDDWINNNAPSITLYATWSPKTVTVTFKPNGGTGSDKTQTFTYGVSGQSFSAKGYSRTNYTQGKWAESATGTGVYAITSGVSDDWINSHAPAITLYATWSKTCPTLTVKKGDGSGYTNSTWTNQNINFTFNFSGTNATKYDWFTNTDGGSYTNWGTKDISATSQSISGSGKRGIRLKLYDSNGTTRECTWTGYWIDKVPPEYVGFSYDGQLVRSDNDDYYNGVVFHFVCADYMSGTATEAVSVKHVNGSGFGTRNGSVVDWTPGIGNYFIEEHCSDVLGNHTQKNWTMDVVSGSGGGNSGSSSSGSNCYLCQCGKTTYTAEGCFNYCSGAVSWYPTNASQSGSSSQGTCFKYCCK